MTTHPDAHARRDIPLIAIFAGVVAALGLFPAISAFGGAVPITAQSLGVMLAGAILGPRRGALALVVFLTLVAIGLPLLAGGRGGLGVFAGPSIGYLIGFPVAAFAVGALTYAFGAPYRLVLGIPAAVVGGVVVLNVLGIIGLVLRADLSVRDATAAALVFVPGDVVKAIVCALVARGVHAAYPGLLPQRRDVARRSDVDVPA
ncbi:biotin transporter BioY [Nocardioides cavernae]|uniref:Biotin transporter n=1 Tax=Nocardioides cavernae TaxID=1921566 RepID=A0ABR8N824_9ACTN|nr:biotin transporter BioY [Nocardioides cavernae]MBD3924298.1 biotin transporter BioY [Nocardioides cavernae]MBM7510760.1 biotin transport system substrate-specific component [Nocardioides cavernae]